MTNLDVWYAHLDLDRLRAELNSGVSSRLRKKLDQGLVRARPGTACRRSASWPARGRPYQIVADPPLIVPAADLTGSDEEAPRLPSDDRRADRGLPAHPARGRRRAAWPVSDRRPGQQSRRRRQCRTRCWILLMLGSDDSDPLFLQVKEAERSVLSDFTEPSSSIITVAGGHRPAVHPGGQRRLPRLGQGRERIDGRPRLLHPPAARLEAIGRGLRDESGWMRRYVGFCGWTLARAHARTGDRFALAGYLGSAASSTRPSRFRREFRRPERARPRCAGAGRSVGPDLGTPGSVTRPIRMRRPPPPAGWPASSAG